MGGCMEDIYFYENRFGTANSFVKQYIISGGNYQFCWHKSIEIMLVLDGSIEIYSGGRHSILKKDDIFVLNSNSGHSLFGSNLDSIIYIMEISPDMFKEYCANIDNIQINCASTDQTRNIVFFRQLRSFLSKSLFYAMNNNNIDVLGVRAYTSVIMTELLKNFAVYNTTEEKQNKKHKNNAILNSVIEYIESNYSNKITLDDIAQVAQYNRTYISTLFKEMVGITLNEYIARIRMKNAIAWLSDFDLPLMTIALNNGYPDSRTLVHNMKKYCGKTPQEYRSSLKKNPDMSCKCGVQRYMIYPNEKVESLMQQYNEEFGIARSAIHNGREGVSFQEIRALCEKIIDITKQ
jgi:AraC-like DNA-binding protein